MKASKIFSIFVALTLATCVDSKDFKNEAITEPHARLRGTTYSNAGHAFATHINDQATSLLRSGDDFRISPGTIIVQTAFSDRRETVGYREIEFVAVDGGDYVLAREIEPETPSPLTAVSHPTTSEGWLIHDQRDHIAVRQVSKNGEDHILAKAPKEDYVFGQPTAEKALAEYRRKNP